MARVTDVDFPADNPFDRVTALAAALFRTPIAAVSMLDSEGYALSSARGTTHRTSASGDSVSQHVVAMGPHAVLAIADLSLDPRTAGNPNVTGGPKVRFYAGAAITTTDGRVLGAVVVADTVPRERPGDEALQCLKMLARIAADICEQLELARMQTEVMQTLLLAESMAGIGHWRWNVDTGQVVWSDEVYRIYGVTPTTFDPSLDNAIDGYHPDDRATLTALIERALATGASYECQLRILRPDGSERVTHAKAQCEQDETGRVHALFGVFQDVTETVRSHDRVTSSEARYRLLADNATDIIATYGMDGVFTYISPSIEGPMGYRAEEMVGRQFSDFIHPQDMARVRATFSDYARAGPDAVPPRVPYRAIRKDGVEVWLEAHPKVIRDASGRPVEFQDVVRDVSDTKRLEADLVEARDRAEDGARAKSEFLSNMSHELRTPLTSVIGFSGLLKDSPTLSETDRGHVQRIALASDSLLGVINDILDYSKLEAGAVAIDPQAFDPRAMAQGAVSIVEGACLAKGLAVRIRIDPSLPAFLLGDEARLRQVVLNFLSNAVKFTSSGGVTVGLDWNGGRMRVSVADTGIGVAPDKLVGLFQRFTQADASTSRLYGGTGLGLSISRRLIEMMGGQVGADSRTGEGSTFWFEAPFKLAAAAHVRAPEGGTVAPENLRILMADDAPANRELVGAILGGMGMAVTTVEDGVQAVEAARTGGYDLILMDVHMPNMDGLDATRAIRGLGGPEAGVPIIALTANVQPEHVARCREAGMDAHVGKPISVAELVRTMVGCLEAAEPVDGAVRGAV